MSCGTKDISCTNTHHDVTDLVNRGMVKNKKPEYLGGGTQLSYETKEFLICASEHILRSYGFVEKVTFKKSI